MSPMLRTIRPAGLFLSVAVVLALVVAAPGLADEQDEARKQAEAGEQTVEKPARARDKERADETEDAGADGKSGKKDRSGKKKTAARQGNADEQDSPESQESPDDEEAPVAVEAVAKTGFPGLFSGTMDGRTLKDFEETRERPLFTPARHPPLPPPPPPPPPPPKEPKVREPKPVKVEPPKPPSLRLVGVLMTGKSELALLLDKERNVQRVGVGDEIDGWAVVKLEPSVVELRFQNARSVYRMFDSAGRQSAGDADERGRNNKRRRRRR